MGTASRLDDESRPADQRRSLICKFVALFGSGEWRVTEWTSDVVRYRDGLSLVVRYTVAALRESAGSRGSRVFYAKAYPDRNTVGANERFADEPGPPCGGHRGVADAGAARLSHRYRYVAVRRYVGPTARRFD